MKQRHQRTRQECDRLTTGRNFHIYGCMPVQTNTSHWSIVQWRQSGRWVDQSRTTVRMLPSHVRLSFSDRPVLALLAVSIYSKSSPLSSLVQRVVCMVDGESGTSSVLVTSEELCWDWVPLSACLMIVIDIGPNAIPLPHVHSQSLSVRLQLCLNTNSRPMITKPGALSMLIAHGTDTVLRHRGISSRACSSIDSSSPQSVLFLPGLLWRR